MYYQALLRIAIIDCWFIPNDKPTTDGKVDTRVLPRQITESQKLAVRELVNGFLTSEYHELQLNYGQQIVDDGIDGDSYGIGIYISDAIIAAKPDNDSKYASRIRDEYHGYEDGLVCVINDSSMVICIMSEPGLNDNLFALTYAINAGKPIYKIWPDGTTEWIRK